MNVGLGVAAQSSDLKTLHLMGDEDDEYVDVDDDDEEEDSGEDEGKYREREGGQQQQQHRVGSGRQPRVGSGRQRIGSGSTCGTTLSLVSSSSSLAEVWEEGVEEEEEGEENEGKGKKETAVAV